MPMGPQNSNNKNVAKACNQKSNRQVKKRKAVVDSTDDDSEDGTTPNQVSHSKQRQVSANVIGGQHKNAARTITGVSVTGSHKSNVQSRVPEGTATMASTISTNNSVPFQAAEVQVVLDKNSQLYKERAEREYNEHLRTAGYLQEKASLKASLKTYVTQTLFCKLKFITSETMLDLNGKIAEKLMNTMKVAENHRESFWDKNRSSINNMLRIKRNNVMVQLKEGFFRK
jgi:hypothetical protein